MTRQLFLCLLLFFVTSGVTAQNFTLSGVVTDVDNGETLIGATVYIPSNGSGTTTNEYGFYSLSVPAMDSIEVVFSYVGFQNLSKTLLLKSDMELDIEMGSGVVLEEVVVKANSFQEQLNNTQMSVEALTTKEVKLLPAFLGEVDILKTIQLKPGIPSGSEGSTGIYVRGGGNDQNLIVLDEAIVYNPNHLFGFFSTFNADAVKDLKIYKGGFPPQYGGRLSSVIDVKLKEGNKKKFSGAGGIGLISSRLTLEGPIEKDKSSFIVSGRRTYFDVITRQVNKSNEGNEDATLIPDYYFYDLNTKINFKLGKHDHLYLSGYFGRDDFGFDNDFINFGFDWGNATGTARWNHTFSPTLFANTTFTYSDYQYEIANKVTGFSFSLSSQIKDINFKTDFYHNVNEQNTLRYGANATYHQFIVGRLKAGSDDGVVSFTAGQEFDGMEYGAYITDDFKLNDRFQATGGLRVSGFSNDNEFYTRLEPRLAANFKVNDQFSIKGSYARMSQYLHLVSSSGISLPTDVWYPTTKLVKPQVSDQIAIGASYLLGEDYFITNEYYYKWLGRQVDFIDGAELFANDRLEDEFVFGDGYAYGAELSLEKKEGKLTGWIGYTFAIVEKGNFEGPKGEIMDGRYFPPRYDRRHDISVVAMYDINRRYKVSSTWVYGSGDRSWLPIARYTIQDIEGAQFQTIVPFYGDRNSYRLPSYHRLDLNFIIKFFPSWGESDLTLSVVNAYDRRNPFFVFLEPEYADDEDPVGSEIKIPTGVAAKQVSLFPILPSITWNFKF